MFSEDVLRICKEEDLNDGENQRKLGVLQIPYLDAFFFFYKADHAVPYPFSLRFVLEVI